MRLFVLTASAIAMTSGAALAEGGQAPQPLPPVTVAAEPYDWSGLYVGLGYSMNAGDLDFINPTLARPMDDGTGASIFAGYLIQNGNLVYGGEVAYYMLNEQTFTGFAANVANFDPVIDVSLRLGYAFDRTLVFGQVGYSMSTVSEPSSNLEYDQTGLNYGLGVDYAVTDQFSIGVLYTNRNMEGDSQNPGQTVEAQHSSLSLRAAFRF